MFSKKNTEHKEPINEDNAAQRIARETMTGDLRDCILDFIKHNNNPLPWNSQGEKAQIDTIDKVTKACEYAATRAVAIIAADGKKTIHAKLESVSIKDDIKGTLVVAKHHPDRHAFLDSQGTTVLIVIADDAAFSGERTPVAINRDQPTLPMDDDAGNEDGA